LVAAEEAAAAVVVVVVEVEVEAAQAYCVLVRDLLHMAEAVEHNPHAFHLHHDDVQMVVVVVVVVVAKAAVKAQHLLPLHPS